MGLPLIMLPPFLRSRTVSWVLRGETGVRHPLSPVIGLGLRNPTPEEEEEKEFALPCGIFETQELFSSTYLTHKSMFAYLSQFKGCWSIQQNLDSDLFWAGDCR